MGTEPTNNAAERALRPAVLWRKGSFGSTSPRGSRFPYGYRAVEGRVVVVKSEAKIIRHVFRWRAAGKSLR